MPNFCPTCGKPLQFENAEICPSCGVRIQAPPTPIEIRNPFLAALLSFFFVGWGQWYCGKTWDGLKFFGAFLVSYLLMIIFSVMLSTQPIAAIFVLILFLVFLGIWIYGMYDAYNTADKINKSEDNFSGKSGLFWLPVVLLALCILLILAAVVAAFVFGMAGNISQTKVVAVTAQQTDSNHIVITYQGGQDANLLRQLTATVTDNTGTSQTKNLGLSEQTTPLEVGSSVTFTGAFSGKDHAIVVGTFTDGVKQVLLDNYV